MFCRLALARCWRRGAALPTLRWGGVVRGCAEEATARKQAGEEQVTVSELATRLGVPSTEVKNVLTDRGLMKIPKANTRLPQNISEVVTMAIGSVPVGEPRPPVVTVMGHVDHGKTTLLDTLRKTSVAEREAGGITQHIGAFSVCLSSGHRITFLDTPGHAAFSAMRARGADVTDIVVLVVAADDGVMEQTKECISLVKQAGVPMVVGINKCDKHGVDVGRVKRELLQHGVHLEEFGGDVQTVEISALEGSGVEALEEAILVQAELANLHADPSRPVQAVVVESHVDKGLGPLATVIVQQGTLRNGCVLVAGSRWGRVRAMLDSGGEVVDKAGPSSPVRVAGWKGLPIAGNWCEEMESEKKAKDMCSRRESQKMEELERETRTRQRREGVKKVERRKGREGWTERRRRRRREKKEEEEEEEEGKEMQVAVLVKGDVLGGVEAVSGVLDTRQPSQVKLLQLCSGVGPVSEGDVETAAAADGVILAFNVPCSKAVTMLAKQKEVAILSHTVIYKLLEIFKEEIECRLPRVKEEEVMGEAVVLKVFKLTGARQAHVAGCRVKSGRLLRNTNHRLIRNKEVIYEGALVGMMRGKEDIDVAKKETECGVSFTVNPAFQEGDLIQCFRSKLVPQKLEWDLGF